MINVPTSLWLRSHVRWSGSTVWDIGRKHRIQHMVTKCVHHAGRVSVGMMFSFEGCLMLSMHFCFLVDVRDQASQGAASTFRCSHVFACSVSSAAVLPKRGRLTCKQPCPDTSIILPSAMQGCGPLVAEHDGFGLYRYVSSTQV